MTEGEKATNKITGRELVMIGVLATFLGVGFLVAFVLTNKAEGAETQYVQVYRGVGEASASRFIEDGVVVVRGSSDYRVAPVEQEYKPIVDPARQWFNAYDAWRTRVAYRKLHPRP